jgi:putative ABC transport system ATP-binding protein
MDVMLLLKQCNKEFNQTFLVITHDEKIAQMGCRTIHICDGNVYKL